MAKGPPRPVPVGTLTDREKAIVQIVAALAANPYYAQQSLPDVEYASMAVQRFNATLAAAREKQG